MELKVVWVHKDRDLQERLARDLKVMDKVWDLKEDKVWDLKVDMVNLNLATVNLKQAMVSQVWALREAMVNLALREWADHKEATASPVVLKAMGSLSLDTDSHRLATVNQVWEARVVMEATDNLVIEVWVDLKEAMGNPAKVDMVNREWVDPKAVMDNLPKILTDTETKTGEDTR